MGISALTICEITPPHPSPTGGGSSFVVGAVFRFTYTTSAQVYVNGEWWLDLLGDVALRIICCPHPSPPPREEEAVLLWARLADLHTPERS